MILQMEASETTKSNKTITNRKPEDCWYYSPGYKHDQTSGEIKNSCRTIDDNPVKLRTPSNLLRKLQLKVTDTMGIFASKVTNRTLVADRPCRFLPLQMCFAFQVSMIFVNATLTNRTLLMSFFIQQPAPQYSA